jgi:metal-sulfur cluster biosynthetic enzyme
MSGEAQRLIGELPGVTKVDVDCDEGLDWEPGMIEPKAQELRHQRLAVLSRARSS